MKLDMVTLLAVKRMREVSVRVQGLKHMVDILSVAMRHCSCSIEKRSVIVKVSWWEREKALLANRVDLSSRDGLYSDRWRSKVVFKVEPTSSSTDATRFGSARFFRWFKLFNIKNWQERHQVESGHGCQHDRHTGHSRSHVQQTGADVWHE